MAKLSELIEKQKKLIEKCQKFDKKIEALLKQKDITEKQRTLAEMTKQWVKGSLTTIEKIGYSAPEFFVGDLLDMKNYYQYFDSFFYGPETSSEERKSGNKHLFEDIKKSLPSFCSPKEWQEFSKEAKQNLMFQVAIDVIDKKSETLESTRKISEILKNEGDILKGYEKNIDDMFREKK